MKCVRSSTPIRDTLRHETQVPRTVRFSQLLAFRNIPGDRGGLTDARPSEFTHRRTWEFFLTAQVKECAFLQRVHDVTTYCRSPVACVECVEGSHSAEAESERTAARRSGTGSGSATRPGHDPGLPLIRLLHPDLPPHCEHFGGRVDTQTRDHSIEKNPCRRHPYRCECRRGKEWGRQGGARPRP